METDDLQRVLDQAKALVADSQALRVERQRMNAEGKAAATRSRELAHQFNALQELS